MQRLRFEVVALELEDGAEGVVHVRVRVAGEQLVCCFRRRIKSTNSWVVLGMLISDALIQGIVPSSAMSSRPLAPYTGSAPSGARSAAKRRSRSAGLAWLHR